MQIIELDTCLPSYFQGYPGVVLAVPVDCSTTPEDLIEGLRTDLNSSDWFGTRQEWSAAEKAVESFAAEVVAYNVEGQPMNAFQDIEPAGEDEEMVYCYLGFGRES